MNASYRQVAAVSTLVAQGLLESVDVVAVPGQEVGLFIVVSVFLPLDAPKLKGKVSYRAVNVVGLQDVSADKVIVTATCTGDCRTRLCWLGLEAKNSVDVLLALLDRKVAPRAELAMLRVRRKILGLVPFPADDGVLECAAASRVLGQVLLQLLHRFVLKLVDDVCRVVTREQCRLAGRLGRLCRTGRGLSLNWLG